VPAAPLAPAAAEPAALELAPPSAPFDVPPLELALAPPAPVLLVVVPGVPAFAVLTGGVCDAAGAVEQLAQ
jgi:hypothetical protein